MTNKLVNSLTAVIAGAAKSLPASTGEVSAVAERLSRMGDGCTILADVSGSMNAVAWGGRSKHSLLVDAIRASARTGDVIVAFSRSASVVRNVDRMPMPDGSTALHIGLRAAIAQGKGHILVVSDGEPDNEALALVEAADFSGTIDVLYIGPDANSAAMDFLKRLARVGRGRYHGSDISRSGQPVLAQTLRKLLR